MPNTEDGVGVRAGFLAAIWRYPVKSMAGEPLETVTLEPRGLVGDRRWAVHCADGRLGSGKDGRRFHRLDPLFTLAAQTSAGSDLGEVVTIRLADGTYLVAGEPETDEALSALVGEPVTVRPEGTDQQHHDNGRLSIVGTATLAALGGLLDGPPMDPRALRANLVVETTVPYVEESWLGRDLAIGDVRLRVVEAIERCRMVDLDQVGLAGRPGLLKAVGLHRDLCAAMYADVLVPGEVARDDAIDVVSHGSEQAASGDGGSLLPQ